MSAHEVAGSPRRQMSVGILVTVAVGFGVLYAWATWAAVDLLVRQATGPLGLSTLGWIVHVLPIVFPVVVFGIAFAIGYRRAAGEFALALLAGLALTAVFWVDILAYALTSYSLYGG